MARCLDEWLSLIESRHPSAIDMGLDRVSEVARRMSLLEAPLAPTVITVAGTNGKGSTLAVAAAVAKAHGKRVGTYTSPHLLHYNERVTLNGQQAEDALLCDGFEQVERARLSPTPISLTYFETGTLGAFWCFKQAALDMLILEIGLGGRLDAVNIIDPDVAIVTTIALDHAGFLGTDLEQIGREKAGIMRPGRPVVLGSRSLPNSVEACAEALEAPAYVLGRDFSPSPWHHQGTWSWQGGDGLTGAGFLEGLPDPGLPIDNAASALQALCLAGMRLSADCVRSAMHDVSLPGRMQWLGQWCLDVGHNPHAASYVAAHLSRVLQGRRCWCLMGMLDDKDAAGVIKALSSQVTDWVCVDLPGPRGLEGEVLADQVRASGGKVHQVAGSPTQGAAWLMSRLDTDDFNRNDVVLATGSFLTVAELLAILPEMPAFVSTGRDDMPWQ